MMFLAPYALLLLLIPSVLMLMSFTVKHKERKEVFSEAILQKITRYPELKKKPYHYKLLLLGITLFMIAYAQPVLHDRYSENTDIIPLVIALDISSSMDANDIYPSRLRYAKKKIASLLEMQPKLKVAVILFAKDAYLAYPMSDDLDSLHYVVSTVPFRSRPGSNLFAALEAGQSMLQGYSSKNILLLSDGTNTDDFSDELVYLKKNKLRLNTLYINSRESGKEGLKTLSLLSGGTFSMHHFSNSGLRLIMNTMAKHAQSSSTSEAFQSEKAYTQLFYYPLFSAIVIMLYLFLQNHRFTGQKQSLLLFAAFMLLFHVSELDAGMLEFGEKYRAQKRYEEKAYKDAFSLYETLEQTHEVRYNSANALYKAKEYHKAIEMYERALSENRALNARIYYNMGNAYFQSGQIKLAKKYYIKSLKIKHDKDAQYNLEYVIHLLKKKSKFKSNPLIKLPKSIGSSSAKELEQISSNYVVRLEKMVLSEEERWMKRIKNEKPTIFLQKLKTTRVSKNVLQDQ